MTEDKIKCLSDSQRSFTFIGQRKSAVDEDVRINLLFDHQQSSNKLMSHAKDSYLIVPPIICYEYSLFCLLSFCPIAEPATNLLYCTW